MLACPALAAPVITTQPQPLGAVDGQPGSLSVTATGATSYQWFKGGVAVANATGSTLSFTGIGSAQTGIYDVTVTGPGGDVLSSPVVVGIVPAAGQRTAGAVSTRDVWQNIHHANGAVYDQFLLSGAAGTFTADPGQIARMSFLDENNSIVQVEMSGAGAITISLNNATGPIAPALYTQSGILYMKGKATLILAGADATTHFTIYSVGTFTNPGVTRAGEPYDGWANVAAAGIISTDGKLGGIHQGNADYNSTTGYTGIYAPTVTEVGGLVVVHNIAASGTAQPFLYFGQGGAVAIKIAGGNLAQPNNDSITVSGLAPVTMGAGQDSCGRAAPAQICMGRFVNDAGTDVTYLASFALVPAGTYTMGNSLSNTGDGAADELPLHSVTLPAFYMAKTLTTWAEWQTVRDWAVANGYTDLAEIGAGKAANHPVQAVKWYDVVKWSNAKSEMEGLTPCYYTDNAQTIVYRTGSLDVTKAQMKSTANGYRLPTEAEWEYEARGGLSVKRFPWGDTISHTQANYNSSTDYPYDESATLGFHPTYNDGTQPYTSPVDAFAANGYGLYDMAGSLWEWCGDWYGNYDSAAQTAPQGPDAGTNRVFRGGSWADYAVNCRLSIRGYSLPRAFGMNLGFRLVFSPHSSR